MSADLIATTARTLGCKKPLVPAHLHKLSFRLHPAFAVAPPKETKWRATGFVPETKDQGQSSACEAHRASLCIAGTLAIAGTPLAWTPSEEDLYRGARAVDRARTTLAGDTLPNLTDDGTFTEAVFQSIAVFGIRPRRVPGTTDGRNSDVEIATVNDEQTLLDLEEDSKFLVAGEYAIDPASPDMELQLRTALAAGIMCGMDFYVDPTFGAWQSSDAPLSAPPDETQPGGGHAIAIVDYFTLPDDTVVYALRNSWSKTSGDGGDYYVTGSFLRGAWGLSIWNVRHAEGAS